MMTKPEARTPADIAQLLYGGDDVSGFGDWNHRGWISHSVREDLF